MDDMIYEEFKGTEIWNFILIVNYLNVEFSLRLILEEVLRVKEELLISKSELDSLWQLRNMFTDSQISERFIRKLKRSKSNKEFFQQLQRLLKKVQNRKTDYLTNVSLRVAF